MNYVIIECHPYEGSFHAGAANAIEDTLVKKGHTVSRINLVKDEFNPVMKSEDLRLWGQGESVDPKVKEYQKEMDQADTIIFPIPIWWGIMPAVLKGFCDKVLLPGWAYKYGDKGQMVGLLTSKKAVVITTMETPVNVYRTHFNNPVDGAFVKDTLETCGMEVQKHFQIDQIVSGGKAHAESKLREILEFFE